MSKDEHSIDKYALTLSQEKILLMDKIDNIDSALEIINSVDLEHADYLVSIESYWAEYGEKPFNSIYENTSYQSAMNQAEKEFMDLNRRKDVQAKSYQVKLLVGNKQLSLPKDLVVGYHKKLRDEYLKQLNL
ncbi:MAG: hypothetical protein KC535_05990 [Nanoarchaeota archaeon]|nr:hypothetical protein [Nanoarchaeota archaeon]